MEHGLASNSLGLGVSMVLMVSMVLIVSIVSVVSISFAGRLVFFIFILSSVVSIRLGADESDHADSFVVVVAAAA